MTSKKRTPKISKTPAAKGRGSPQTAIAGKDWQKARDFVDHLTDAEKQDLLLSVSYSMSESYSGPLPSPEDFAKYGAVLPDAPERIMTMAEEEQEIRKDGQTRMLINDEKSMNRAALVAMGLIGAFMLATWLGSVPLGIASIFPLVFRMLYGLLQRKSARGSR
ncbi:MAG: DUF2335 domain-containing protein [Gammaproteobacteria bacterium]